MKLYKNILIISFLFPPRGEIGALRVGKFAKYLKNLFWNVNILTVKEKNYINKGTDLEIENNSIFRTYYFDSLFWRRFFYKNFDKKEYESKKIKIRDKLYPFIKILPFMDLSGFPDSAIGWYPFAIKKIKNIMKKINANIIFSSSPPATSHLVASYINKKYKIPWIADFRDLWSQNYTLKSVVCKKIITKIEKYIINNASAITTVSYPWAVKLNKLHNKKVFLITNGFDQDNYDIKVKLASKFTISYTGTIYPRKQNLFPLLYAIKSLKEERKIEPNKFELRFYGNEHGIIQKFIKIYNLEELIKIYNNLEHKLIIIKQKESHLLIILDWEDERQKGVIPGKIFEYLGAGRPILNIGFQESEIAKLLSETQTGITTNNTKEIENILEEYIKKFQNKENIILNSNKLLIQKCTYLHQANKLSKVLSSYI